jgi:hypothetical protein
MMPAKAKPSGRTQAPELQGMVTRPSSSLAVAAAVLSALGPSPAAADAPAPLDALRRDLAAGSAAPGDLAAARAGLAALRGAVGQNRRGIAEQISAGMPPGAALALAAVRAEPPTATDRPPAAVPGLAPAVLPAAAPLDDRLARLFDLIAAAEAGAAQYDAIHHRARILPPRPPTALTLGEILTWIEATPGQPHAIGRYQIIPDTLRYLIRAEALPHGAVFSPALQDRLATRLVLDAGLDEYLAGLIPPRAFMDKLAYVWAGLPLPDGQSAYQGIAGNKATISRARYEAEFLAILPPPPLLIGLPPLPDPAARGTAARP